MRVLSKKIYKKKYGEPTAEALVESALRHIDMLDKLNFFDFKVFFEKDNLF